MNRRWWPLLPLSLLAVWINLHPPQVFFDQQLMLGSSMAVLALLQFGWRGIGVGIAAYLVTWHTWGHPFELINGSCWLISLLVFQIRFNGGPAQRSNGRIVLATIAYWMLIGVPAEWLWFRFGLNINPTEALSLGLKELVTAVLSASLGLLLFQAVQLLNPRQRQRGLLVRGVTFSVLLLAITLPGLMISLIVSNQLNTQALAAHREAMRSFGREVAQLGRLGDRPEHLRGISVRVNGPNGELFNSDPALFRQLASSYGIDHRQRGQAKGMVLLVPRRRLPTLIANQQSYWQTELRRGDQLITVVQPGKDLIHTLAYDYLMPSFSVVALLLISAALVSEATGSLLNRELQRVVQATKTSNQALSSAHQSQRPSRSMIQEVNRLVKAIRASTRDLEASKTRYANFFNLPLVGTAITSCSQGWVAVNQQTCDLLGYSREELIQTTWAELTHPDDLEADEAQFQRMLRREIDGYQLEKRFIRKDGTIVHTLLAGGCGAIGDNPVDLCYVNIIDISERKRVEAELAAAQERERLAEEHHRRQLEQKLKTSLTAAAVVHEIQQPLASILLNCRLAIRRLNALPTGAIPPDLDYHLRGLIRDGDQVVTTVDRMRMLLRNVETEHVLLDLNANVKSALMFLRPLFRREQVELITEGIDHPCPFHGDSEQLQIALLNLIRNAVEAMGNQRSASRQLLVQLRRIPQGLEIVLADSGPGFPDGFNGESNWEVLKSTKPSGMGLGLFLAQTAVNNHRGQLRIGRSPELGGAEVVVVLPQTVPDAITQRAQAGDAAPRVDPLRFPHL